MSQYKSDGFMDLLHDKWYKVVPCGKRSFAVTEVRRRRRLLSYMRAAVAMVTERQVRNVTFPFQRWPDALAASHG